MAKTIHKAKKWSEKNGAKGMNTQLLNSALKTAEEAKAHKKAVATQVRDAQTEVKGASKALKAALRTAKADKKAQKAATKS